WRDLAIGLSLANLCYVRIWSETLTYRHADTFWMKHPPLPAEFLAVMLNVLLLGGLLALMAILVRRNAAPRIVQWSQRGFVLFFLIPANALRSVLSNQFPYLKSPLFEVIGQTGVLVLGIAI